MGLTIFWSRLNKFSVFDFILTGVFITASIIIQNIAIHDDYVPGLLFDTTQIQHTQTIPTVIHYSFIFFVFPLFITLIWAALVFDYTIVNLISAYSFNIAFASFVAALLSFMIARPRPDTLTICGGQGAYSDCLAKLSKKQANWQFRSLPSVTVTESFASGGFASLLLFDIWHSTPAFVMTLKFFPLIYPIAVAAIDICDRVSHVDDIVLSAFIGAIVTMFTYSTFKTGQKLIIRPNQPRNDVLSVVTSYV